ncbi:hypothetical protein D1AOALGA4SA_8279 [Olavius algarvensis Delta 1 endosymbiont]|nr:hypothetical protein D1AOALGA4SA_8279 [Olavius algarvensis Delta 1 endosymbiont]
MHKKQAKGIPRPTRLSTTNKDPGPEDPALISPQRGGVYLRIPME